MSNLRSLRNASRRAAIPLILAGLLIGATAPLRAAEPGAKPQPPEISSAFSYDSKFVEVLGSRLHYVDKGAGQPILFLHGNPTSSYLWRNVMPHVEARGRVIALDLVGFGKSDKPDIGYSFQDHARYLAGFIDALDLTGLTLVLHDWGTVLGLDYASRHEDRVEAVAFMEALIPPAFPMQHYADFGPFEETFRGFRDPVVGPQMIVEQNVFIEGLLPGSVLRELGPAEMTAYREPFLEPAARKPILVWPNELPIEGTPARNAEVILAVGEWLKSSDMPKLLQYVSPGAIVTPDSAAWMAETYRNLETQFVGYGLHYIQEDNPEAIGRGIADWMRRIGD